MIHVKTFKDKRKRSIRYLDKNYDSIGEIILEKPPEKSYSLYALVLMKCICFSYDVDAITGDANMIKKI